MRFGSLFSGIGGFDLGFERAGMTCAWQCEIDAACRGVLGTHFGAEIIEDVCNVRRDNVSAVDLVCGGFPCQDLSIAGKRAGLAGERSGLWFEFHRVLDDLRPQWVVIENVPGLLSSNGGRDFATILRGLVELGYGVCWRILDAQYFGVAQRRRRVFIVGSLGDGRAAQVLFESAGMYGDPPARTNTGKGDTPAVASGINGSGLRGRQPGSAASTVSRPLAHGSTNNHYDSQESKLVMVFGGNNGNGEIDVATACNAHGGTGRLDFKSETFIAFSGMAQAGAGWAPPSCPTSENLALPLDSTRAQSVMKSSGIRRLMPVECERLQGFPDGWTDGQSDSARYRQLGNAVAVPVIEWLGRRIEAANNA